MLLLQITPQAGKRKRENCPPSDKKKKKEEKKEKKWGNLTQRGGQIPRVYIYLGRKPLIYTIGKEKLFIDGDSCLGGFIDTKFPS